MTILQKQSRISAAVSAAEARATQQSALNASLAKKAALAEAGTDYQPLDSDLTAIAAIIASDGDFIQRVSGVWAKRSASQTKTALSLGNVDNTADADKPISTLTQAALDALEALLGTNFQSAHAIEVVLSTYGDTVSISAKGKDLRKWGARTSVGTDAETLMTVVGSEIDETFVSTNAITTVVSSSSSDTQVIEFYEGHTISGLDASFLYENNSGSGITLTGTTPVTLPTSVFRANRARLASAAVGNIYFYEGGTRTDANTHLVIPAGEVQSQKASTAISSSDYWFISNATLTVLEKTSAWVQCRIEIKPISSSSYYPITQWAGCSDASGNVNILDGSEPWLIVPPNHDVRMAVKANAANVDVAGGMVGPLAAIQ